MVRSGAAGEVVQAALACPGTFRQPSRRISNGPNGRARCRPVSPEPGARSPRGAGAMNDRGSGSHVSSRAARNLREDRKDGFPHMDGLGNARSLALGS